MNSRNIKKLQQVFKGFPEVEAVYLFGSEVSGAKHRESDLDLAVIPATESLRAKKLDILHSLAREGFCNVDLVFPDKNNIVLLFEVVRANTVIYQKNSFQAGEYFSRVLRQYFDFYPYLAVQRKAYKQRILDGAS